MNFTVIIQILDQHQRALPSTGCQHFTSFLFLKCISATKHTPKTWYFAHTHLLEIPERCLQFILSPGPRTKWLIPASPELVLVGERCRTQLFSMSLFSWRVASAWQVVQGWLAQVCGAECLWCGVAPSVWTAAKDFRGGRPVSLN